MDNEQKTVALMVVYSGIVAMQYHPGAKARLSPDECLVFALEAVEVLCRGLSEG